jgi:hypothetical protein
VLLLRHDADSFGHDIAAHPDFALTNDNSPA